MNTFIRTVGLAFLCTCFIGCKTALPEFESFPKIDTHVHVRTTDPSFVEQAKLDNFQLLTITTRSASLSYIQEQLEFAWYQKEIFPETIYYTTTFSMEDFGQTGWQDSVITRLKKDFDNGAIAVKVWKDIGMTFRDTDSSFIMIDDPRFDPVLDFIASEGKSLVAHIGEPKNCWLPLDSMTVKSDLEYFRNHPEYHMYLHPDYPSYEDQIRSRDHMLEKHPDLKVIGAHLGSLEWKNWRNALTGIPILQWTCLPGSVTSRYRTGRKSVVSLTGTRTGCSMEPILAHPKIQTVKS